MVSVLLTVNVEKLTRFIISDKIAPFKNPSRLFTDGNTPMVLFTDS